MSQIPREVRAPAMVIGQSAQLPTKGANTPNKIVATSAIRNVR
jgi:hypothetical protein